MFCCAARRRVPIVLSGPLRLSNLEFYVPNLLIIYEKCFDLLEHRRIEVVDIFDLRIEKRLLRHGDHPPKPRRWSAGFVLLLSLRRLQHHPRQLLLYLSKAKLSLFVGCAVYPVVALAVRRVRLIHSL